MNATLAPLVAKDLMTDETSCCDSRSHIRWESVTAEVCVKAAKYVQILTSIKPSQYLLKTLVNLERYNCSDPKNASHIVLLYSHRYAEVPLSSS